MKKVRSLTSEIAIVEVSASEARTELEMLLLSADEDWQLVLSYLSDCHIWALSKSQVGFIGCIAVLPEDQIWEVKNLAVGSDWQRQGLGTRLMQFVYQQAVIAGMHELSVGTGDVNFSNLRFYYHLGYRAKAIKKNFYDQYSEPIFEDGLQLQDMIVLARSIN